jgi:hypothetical protein
MELLTQSTTKKDYITGVGIYGSCFVYCWYPCSLGELFIKYVV